MLEYLWLENIDPRYSSRFTEDRNIKREAIILSSGQIADISLLVYLSVRTT